MTVVHKKRKAFQLILLLCFLVAVAVFFISRDQDQITKINPGKTAKMTSNMVETQESASTTEDELRPIPDDYEPQQAYLIDDFRNRDEKWPGYKLINLKVTEEGVALENLKPMAFLNLLSAN